MKKLVVLISAMIILLSLTACVQKDDIGYYTAEDFGMSEITPGYFLESSSKDVSSLENSSVAEIASDDAITSSGGDSSLTTETSSKAVSSKESSSVQNSNDALKAEFQPEPEFKSTLKKISPPVSPKKPAAAEIKGEVLDSGKCGEELNWELYSNGTLRIFGKGKMYDYYKYYEPSPWYKYRSEPYVNEAGTSFLNPDGTSYMPVKGYNEDNPNGWKIKAIRIEDGVTYIGDWAFYRVCVENLVIPEGVQEIGAYGIRFSPVLKSLWLPDSLKTINDFGITRNVVLKSIYFGNGLQKVGNGGLQLNAIEELIFPDSLVSVGVDMHGDFETVDTEKNNGVFSGCRYLKKVRMGNFTDIPQRAFMNCESLETVIIPKTVTYIGEYAFSECKKLTTVEFEQGSVCKSFDSYAFYSCKALKRFTGALALETVSKNAFAATNNIEEFEFSDKNKEFYAYIFSGSPLKWAKIGDNLTEIPGGFLNKTKIKSLYISKNVKSFGGQIVNGCSELKNIYFEGTKAEWDKITKTYGWANETPEDCIVHFSDNTAAYLKNAIK